MSTTKNIQKSSGINSPIKLDAGGLPVFDGEGNLIFEETEIFHDFSHTLDEWKAIRDAEVNTKTKCLIESGFTWNGEEFSTSETAQRNWLALKLFAGDLTYPKRISTKADTHYDIADQTEMENFVGYGLAVLEARYASGVDLRDQINAATTIEEIDAVVDNR